MSDCPFDVGDVVVCVDARPAPKWAKGMKPLNKNGIYRVTGVVPSPAGAAGVLVNGDEPARCPKGPRGWRCDRFRKIDNGVTDGFRHQMRSLGKRDPVPA
jgi:hypothetical protein